MSVKLRELIRQIRNCKTAAEERALVAKEMALIRTAFKDAGEHRTRNIAKLLYLNMLGYSTHFGQVECLKLIASPRFHDKRIGYLGLNLLLDEKQEVLMLVTNSMKNDFLDKTRVPFISGLALCSLGNIASADMARDLSNEIKQLLSHHHPDLRKKAALAAVRVLRKVPELLEEFIDGAIRLLDDKIHSVLLPAVTLIIEMIKIEKRLVKRFRSCVHTLVGILKRLVHSGATSEYDICGVFDPFLQCKVLELLGELGHKNQEASDAMTDILAQVATNTQFSKNTANAVLYQCTDTILKIEAESGLRMLAINILGRFLGSKENNIRFVSLNTCNQLAASDTKALQRHTDIILECLRDSDYSIKKHALDLVYSLSNKDTAADFVKQLLEHLQHTTDRQFRANLADTICLITEKLSAGNLVRESIVFNLIGLLQHKKDMHAYAVYALFHSLHEMKSFQTPLVQAGVWCIGEFGQLLVSAAGAEKANAKATASEFAQLSEDTVLDLLEKLLIHYQASSAIKAYILNALVKLSSKRVVELLVRFKSSVDVDLQQRAIEYDALINSQFSGIRAKIMTAIPALEKKEVKQELSDDEEDEDEDEDDEEEEEEETKKPSETLRMLNESPPQQQQQQQPAKPATIDILAGIFDSVEAATTSTAPSSSSNPLDILMGGDSSFAMAPAALPSLSVFDKAGLAIQFEFKKEAPEKVLVTALFSNRTANAFENFEFKVAVPKFIKIKMRRATSATIPPNSNALVSQQIELENTQPGIKKLVMRCKIDYSVNGSAVTETIQVSDFPDGVDN